MKTRWKILIGFAAVLAILALVAAIHHFQLKSAVERYKAELKAKGELMELAEVVPLKISPEKNSAAQFFVATDLFTTNENILTTNWPLAMRGMAPGKAQISWQQPNIRDLGMTNSWEDLGTALSENAEALSRLVAITNSPQFDFGLRYDQRFEMRITNLVVEKKAAHKLAAKTINDLRFGKNGAAAANIHTMLGIVEGTRDERTAISQLVRIAIAQIACATTWEFLQSTNVTESQLAGLQADWSRPEFIQAMVNVLPVEREGGMTAAATWRNSNAEMQRYFDLSKKAGESLGHFAEEETVWDKAKNHGQVFLWRYWWSYTDELRCLKGYQVLMDTMRLSATNGAFQEALAKQSAALDRLGILYLNSSLDSLFSGKTDFHSMLSESIVTLVGLSSKVMRVEVARQVVITALALKRFQLQHGGFPADLNALAPKFISTVPRDPVDGQPIRYQRNADETFLLYSIGENGKDDGGNPSLEKVVEGSNFNWLNLRALDWVWPQPATDAEIKFFYEHPPK